jgi:hypothetical protein
MRLTSFVLGVSLLAGLASSTSAHHSFTAEYDREKPLTLTGAVTRIEWQNPHAYFYMDVKDAATGRVVNWAFEMGAPAVLQRSGWKRSSMKIGDVLTVEDGLPRTVHTTRTLAR